MVVVLAMELGGEAKAGRTSMKVDQQSMVFPWSPDVCGPLGKLEVQLYHASIFLGTVTWVFISAPADIGMIFHDYVDPKDWFTLIIGI